MLYPPKRLGEIQTNLVCELLTEIGRAAAFFLAPPPGPRGGVKRFNIIKFQLQSQIERFLYKNFVCVLTMSGTLGRSGCAGGQKKFKHGHVAYQINGDDEQNRMQVKFSSWVKLVTLG